MNERWPEGWEIGFAFEVKRATIGMNFSLRCGASHLSKTAVAKFAELHVV
jgi:hypothetical protein